MLKGSMVGVAGVLGFSSLISAGTPVPRVEIAGDGRLGFVGSITQFFDLDTNANGGVAWRFIGSPSSGSTTGIHGRFTGAGLIVPLELATSIVPFDQPNPSALRIQLLTDSLAAAFVETNGGPGAVLVTGSDGIVGRAGDIVAFNDELLTLRVPQLGFSDSVSSLASTWILEELSLIHISEPTRPY